MITRAPPPSGRPPMYAVAGRAFGRTNLRPVIIGFTIAALIWSLIWTAGAFEDIRKETNDMHPLVIFTLIFGSLYAAIAAIMLFGLVAAVTQRTPLARLFSGFALFTVVLVGAAELTRTIGHFMHRGPIINQCENASKSTTSEASLFWGGESGRDLTADEAADFCTSLYNRASASTIAWLLLSMIFALFFASIAFSFYRQLLDPNTFRAPRAPSDLVRLDALRHQQEPYGGGYMPYPGFHNATNYAPPPGPPPLGLGGYNAPPYEDRELPGYGVDFAAKDMGDEKDGDTKGGDPFMDAQHTGLDSRGPSETDLSHRS